MTDWQKEEIKEIIATHGESGGLHRATHFTGSKILWLVDGTGRTYYQWIFLTTGEMIERHGENPHWWWVTIEGKRDVDLETDDQFLAVAIAIAEEVGSMM